MMMAHGWRTAFVIFLLPFEVLTVQFREDGPLKFHCPGDKMVAMVEYWNDIMEICGRDFELMFNGSHTGLNSGKLTFHFSSFPNEDYAVPLHHTSYDIGSLHSEWSLTTSVNIDNQDLPCGAGYIIAVVEDNGMKKFAAAQRGVRVCDFSDLDIELSIDAHLPNNSIHLTADGRSLMEQLSHQNVIVNKMVVENHGTRKLDNVTMENPYMILFYLRRLATPETMTQMCNVPSYRLDDTVLGAIKFCDAIHPYGIYEAREDPVMPIVVDYDYNSVSICGDAELVMMLDPLGMLNDSNPCNNFVRISVYVDCPMYKGHMDTCTVVPNVMMAGREAITMFQDIPSPDFKMYKYWVDDNRWERHDAYDHKRQVEQVGLAKFVIMNKVLPWMYNRYNNRMYPCDMVWPMVKTRLRFERMMGQSNYTIDQAILSTMAALRMRLNNMNSMTDNDDLKKDIEMFGNNTSVIQNEALRMKVRGMALGMQHLMGMKYSMDMAKMYGHPIPHNITRTTLGPMFFGLAELFKHMSEQSSPLMLHYMLPTVMEHTAMVMAFIDTDMFDIPNDVRENIHNILNNVLDFPLEMMGQVNNESMCSESRFAHISKYMLYLSMGHDGQKESKLDAWACEQQMLASYMAHGGAYVLAKDILDEVAEKMDRKDMPAECRPHPFMPIMEPPVLWKVDQEGGEIWMATYSPLADVMTWKVAAVCRCDGCPAKTATPYGDMYSSTTPSWNMGMTGTTMD